MKKSTNALILSALVFPGAGHLYLKKIKTGLTLICITLIALIYIISDIMDRTFSVVEQVQSGTVAVDMGSIRALIEQQPAGEWVGMASYIIVGCWLVGMIDCYRRRKAAS